ncbi:MAG: hypothetical protein ACYSUC_07930 [Planctomycetota bacterium]|jgi:hypothetical protein
MEEERLGKLLNQLAERRAEPVRPGLAAEIKQHIPERLPHHRKGLDTINIVIDLRIGKLAAAAVVIITLIVLANMQGIYQEGKLLARYLLTEPPESEILAERAKHLTSRGMGVVIYENVDSRDSNSVLMHWELPGGSYRVVFGDFREEEVSAEALIELQARMLQRDGE